VREARFRRNVVAAYNYTCALTGYRLTTISAGCIVDAAHIHQFASSRNNDPRNGLALWKNAHWFFDTGL
jgi:putative restriction endonuclease